METIIGSTVWAFLKDGKDFIGYILIILLAMTTWLIFKYRPLMEKKIDETHNQHKETIDKVVIKVDDLHELNSSSTIDIKDIATENKEQINITISILEKHINENKKLLEDINSLTHKIDTIKDYNKDIKRDMSNIIESMKTEHIFILDKVQVLLDNAIKNEAIRQAEYTHAIANSKLR